MILLAYDGSDNAKDAIKHAGVLFKGQPAAVLVVWEQYSEIVARAPRGFDRVKGTTDYQRQDEASRKYGEEEAEEGAAFAREAGLEATPRTAPRSGALADTILAEADAVNADAIVLGTRGRGGIGTFLLGSVSHHLLQSADRPVLVVPSPEVASQRAEKLRARR